MKTNGSPQIFWYTNRFVLFQRFYILPVKTEERKSGSPPGRTPLANFLEKFGKKANLICWCIEIFTSYWLIATVPGFCFFLFSQQVEPVDLFCWNFHSFTSSFYVLSINHWKTKQKNLWPYLLGVLSMLGYFSSLLNFIFVSGLVSDWQGMCQVPSQWTSLPHQANTISWWRTNRHLFLPIMQVS